MTTKLALDSETNQDFFKNFFESIPLSLIVVNANDEIIYLNSFTEKLFGYHREELLKKSIDILIPNRYRKKHAANYSNYFKKPEVKLMGKGRELFALKKNLSEFPVEIGLSPLTYNNDTFVIASIIDISSRKESEKVIRDNRNKLQLILDNSPDSIIVYDIKGNIIQKNKESELNFFKNKTIKNIKDIIPIEHQNSFKNKLKEAKSGKKVIDWETERILLNGNKIVVSSSIIFAQTDENIFIETLRDITDRVNIRNKIVEYEKAQIFAKISEGIAHHMGTPLSSMLLRIQMLKDDMENEKELSAYVNKLQLIENQIHYGKNIMQRLLKFSSESPGEKTKVDFLSIINEAIEVLYPILSKKNISIKINNENEYKIYADSDMIKLVISDILMNSIDALNNNGNIYIELSSDKNNFVNLKIRDNGKGIPSKVLPYVFEPFYTTKPAGKGTGLGLAVAKRIIKDHNGNISIESIEGKETVVNINLPEYNLLNENE